MLLNELVERPCALNVRLWMVQGTHEQNVKLFMQLERESTRQLALAVA
jgi:hypothetical protein